MREPKSGPAGFSSRARASSTTLRRQLLPLLSPLLLPLLLPLVFSGTARANGEGPWEKVSDTDGIFVQRRTVEGSNLKEFRGSGLIAAPIGRVLSVMRDAPRRVEWMPECSGSYVVEEDEKALVQIAYHRTRVPWPASDRDSVNRAELHFDPALHRVVVPFEAIDHPKAPPVAGVVRMPFLRGHWILVAVEHGAATRVEYQVHADPGGVLPDWIANFASKSLPRETIAGLRKQVTRAAYPAFEAEVLRSPEWKKVLDGAN